MEPFNLQITYDNLNVDEVLKKALPSTLVKPPHESSKEGEEGKEGKERATEVREWLIMDYV